MNELTNKNLIWFRKTSPFASISAHKIGREVVVEFQDRFYNRREKMSEQEFLVFRQKREK
jgi:hypothetical protein